jgi:hypothetical protein
VIAAPVTFRQMDFTNANTKIGLIENPGAGGYVLDRCRFHDIGELPPTNTDHGEYDEASSPGLITDCAFQRCADRGIQLRNATGTQVAYTLVELCGEGVIFGDLTTRNCLVTKSILRNNVVTSRYLVEALGDVAGCAVTDSCVYNDDGRPAIQPGLPGVVVSGINGAPLAGYGPRYAIGPTA